MTPDPLPDMFRDALRAVLRETAQLLVRAAAWITSTARLLAAAPTHVSVALLLARAEARAGGNVSPLLVAGWMSSQCTAWLHDTCPTGEGNPLRCSCLCHGPTGWAARRTAVAADLPPFPTRHVGAHRKRGRR